MSQQMEKDSIGCFGAPREKEGKTSWRSPENVGQVDLGFWYLGFWTPRLRPKDVGK
jgi:hypothetical protein